MPCRAFVPQIMNTQNLVLDCEPFGLDGVLLLEGHGDRALPCLFLGGTGNVVGVMIRGGRLCCFDPAEVGFSVSTHVVSDLRRIFDCPPS